MTPLSPLIAVLSYVIALCGIVPLYPWLDLLPRLFLAAGMSAGIWQDRRGAWPLKNWMLNASIVPLFLYYAAQFSRFNAVQPVVSMLAVMLAVRLLGEKSGRHYLQIQSLSLFCLASSSLFDLSPSFLLYLTLLLLLAALSLVLLTFQAHDSRMTLSSRDLRRVLAAGLLIPLAALPLLVFFFPLLPRTQLPLWNLLAAPASRPSGFSDKVETGGSSNVGDSSQLVFRAELSRLPQQLYWRGTVFNRLSGQRWVRDAAVPAERIVYGTERVSQVIYPEPALSRNLLALDAAAEIRAIRVKRSADGVYELPLVSGRRQNYQAESSSRGMLPVKGSIDRDFYLLLPETVPARIRSLAAEIRGRADSDQGRLTLLEDYFRNGNFRYGKQGLPTGEHALEQFLFESRQGHCEFFASGFAVLARAAGVPTRLVGGYLGGEYNDLGGYYLVSEQMAHVWVEVFIDGKGWLRIDPSSFAVNSGAIWGVRQPAGLVKRLRMVLDSFDHAWNRSVITYDLERQIEVARHAGKWLQAFRAERVLNSVFRPLMALAAVVGIALVLTNRRRLLLSAQERLLRGFYRRVARDCGIQAQPGSVGLFELAEQSGNHRVRTFADIYAAAVYRDRRLTREELLVLKRLLREGFNPPS